MAAKFISVNTPLIAQLYHHFDHTLKCAVRMQGREDRTSSLPKFNLILVIFMLLLQYQGTTTE